jgi:hypothetical protein
MTNARRTDETTKDPSDALIGNPSKPLKLLDGRSYYHRHLIGITFFAMTSTRPELAVVVQKFENLIIPT